MSERHVSLRPAPDTMCYLTALLPMTAGVGIYTALARHESPAKGGRLLGLAKALVTEMPHTLAALESGQLNEWRATLLVRETACLAAADRAAVDEHLAPDTGALAGAGDRRLVATAPRLFRSAALTRPARLIRLSPSGAGTTSGPCLPSIVPLSSGGLTIWGDPKRLQPSRTRD